MMFMLTLPIQYKDILGECAGVAADVYKLIIFNKYKYFITCMIK
jgi:hypothetical protein